MVSIMISVGVDNATPSETFLSLNRTGTINYKITYSGKNQKPQILMVIIDVKVCCNLSANFVSYTRLNI